MQTEAIVLIVLAAYVAWMAFLLGLLSFYKWRGSDFHFLRAFMTFGVMFPPALLTFVMWLALMLVTFIAEALAYLLSPDVINQWSARFMNARIRRFNDTGIRELNHLLERRWATIHYGSYEVYLAKLEDEKKSRKARAEAQKFKAVLQQAAGINARLQSMGTTLLEQVQNGTISAEEAAQFAQMSQVFNVGQNGFNGNAPQFNGNYNGNKQPKQGKQPQLNGNHNGNGNKQPKQGKQQPKQMFQPQYQAPTVCDDYYDLDGTVNFLP